MTKTNSLSKVFTFLFTLAMLCIFSINGTVYAQENRSNKTVINEYQLLKGLNKEYNEKKQAGSLKNSKFENMSDEAIRVIENYKESYSKKIKDLQSKRPEELKFFNYTDSQIEAIYSFDGSEEMLMAAASTCTVSGDFNSFNPSSSGTTAQLIMQFRWSGIQSNWFDDLFAVTWSAPFNAVSLSGYVEYKNADYDYLTITHSPGAEGLYGSYIQFPKYKDISGKAPYYLTAGSMIINLKSNTLVQDITGYSEYGYTYISISPTVTFDGNLGISFSTGTSTAGSHRCFR